MHLRKQFARNDKSFRSYGSGGIELLPGGGVLGAAPGVLVAAGGVLVAAGGVLVAAGGVAGDIDGVALTPGVGVGGAHNPLDAEAAGVAVLALEPGAPEPAIEGTVLVVVGAVLLAVVAPADTEGKQLLGVPEGVLPAGVTVLAPAVPTVPPGVGVAAAGAVLPTGGVVPTCGVLVIGPGVAVVVPVRGVGIVTGVGAAGCVGFCAGFEVAGFGVPAVPAPGF